MIQIRDHQLHDLTDALRRQIRSAFQPGEDLPSERALAAMHGASQSTLHRALLILSREELVLSRPRAGWTRASQSKISMEPRPAGRVRGGFKVGLLTPRLLMNWPDIDIYPAILQEAQERGIEVVQVPNSRQRRTSPASIQVELATVPWNTFDVGLLVEVEDQITLSNPLLKQRKVLAVDQDARTFGIDSAAFMDAEAGATAARYLFDRGHRNFAVIDEVNDSGYPCDPALMARKHGFESAIGRLGGVIKPEWRLPYRRSGCSYQPNTADVIRRWKTSSQRPTALFVSEAGLLERLVHELDRVNLYIPQDLSVVSVTWNGKIFRHNGVNFNSVDMDLSVLVRRTFDAATELALQKLPHVRPSQYEPRLFSAPMMLVPGESVRHVDPIRFDF